MVLINGLLFACGNESDQADVSDSYRGPNRPPVLNPIGNKTVGEGETLQFTVVANDPDGDALTYSASNLPTGATFDPATQTFIWTPGYAEAGNYTGIHFEVSDGLLIDSEDIVVTVNAANPLPDLTGAWLVFPSSTEHMTKGTLSVTNIGAIDAGRFEVAYFLSNDGSLDSGDQLLSTKRVNSLVAGANISLIFTYNASTQEKFIIAVVDSGNTVLESSEENNLVPSPQIP